MTLSKPTIQRDIDPTIVGLFCGELRMQVGVLTPNLLRLEAEGSDREVLAALMRASHSLKGAARMVHLDLIVGLAHEMENYFVMLQSGLCRMNPSHCDRLLQSIDLLILVATRLEQVLLGSPPFPSFTDCLAEEFESIQACTTAIAKLCVSEPGEEAIEVSTVLTASPVTVSPVTTPPVTAPPVTALANLPSPDRDRTIRLSRDHLKRLMGLVGESLTESTWLDPFGRSLHQVKVQQSHLMDIIDQLQANSPHDLDPKLQSLIAQAQSTTNLCRQSLHHCMTELDDFSRRSTQLSDRLYQEVIHSQMRPFSDISEGFPRLVRDLARQVNKQVKLEITGTSTLIDRDMLDRLETPLTHLLTNAIDHGIESLDQRLQAGKKPYGTLHLNAHHRAGNLVISLRDDGCGIDLQQLRRSILDRQLAPPDLVDRLSESELLEFLYLPGFSTAPDVTQLSGRGVGLDAVHTLVQSFSGFLKATTELGVGSCFALHLPLTLSVLRTLVVEIAHQPYAISMHRLDRVLRLSQTEIFEVENRPCFLLDQRAIALVDSHQLLSLPNATLPSTLNVLMLGDRENRYGLRVDQILGEEKLVVKPIDPRLGKIPNVAAAAIRTDGSIALILDGDDLLQSMGKVQQPLQWESVDEGRLLARQQRILVIDDSITVRETERKLLEAQGYSVDTAVNGSDGWNVLQLHPYDLVITDIDMPRMNGIELVNQMKQNTTLQDIPTIIISYKDREDDRRQGLAAGANYYLTKSSFQDDTLLQAVQDLIGPAWIEAIA